MRAACAAEWEAYTWHPFVRAIADGTLPLAAFRRYLIQDYLFLIHFARAKALALFKAESVEAMRAKVSDIGAILSETLMHLRYCEGWGISQAEVLATPEAAETVSYTRYVIDRGLAGDILDLEVALAPCTVGYAEVALRIEHDPGRRREGNPYETWIATYAAPGYQALAQAAAARIDALGVSHGGEARFPMLSAIFSEAARLEARFWQMGLDAARGAAPEYEKARR
nr:thiaminase II [Caldovatus aquaticus]